MEGTLTGYLTPSKLERGYIVEYIGRCTSGTYSGYKKLLIKGNELKWCNTASGGSTHSLPFSLENYNLPLTVTTSSSGTYTQAKYIYDPALLNSDDKYVSTSNRLYVCNYNTLAYTAKTNPLSSGSYSAYIYYKDEYYRFNYGSSTVVKASKYNKTSDTWTAFSDITIPTSFSYVFACVSDTPNIIYLITATSSTSGTISVGTYNLDNNTYTLLFEVTGDRLQTSDIENYNSSCVYSKGKIFFFEYNMIKSLDINSKTLKQEFYTPQASNGIYLVMGKEIYYSHIQYPEFIKFTIY